MSKRDGSNEETRLCDWVDISDSTLLGTTAAVACGQRGWWRAEWVHAAGRVDKGERNFVFPYAPSSLVSLLLVWQ